MNKQNKIKFLKIFGIGTLLTGIAIFLVIFWPQFSLDINFFLLEHNLISNPYISQEAYQAMVKGLSTGLEEFTGRTDNFDMVALRRKAMLSALPNSSYLDFGILIPKINADAPIVKNVDPFDIEIYKVALGMGIAHANTSAVPVEVGNIFLFAHSGRNFYDNIGINVQFYLLDKLTAGDLIIINYEKQKFVYQIKEVKIVEQTESQYIFKDFKYNEGNSNTLVLMSCWPAGMNVKRQVVLAEQL